MSETKDSPVVAPDPKETNLTQKTEESNRLQLSLVITGLWISLFLCALETTIVSTALIRISSELNDLTDSGWIVVAYMLTYNAFILIWSKLSDSFGTKRLLLLANIFFGVFSLACAVSKKMVQLIIFRALQGVGGSGMYSLVFVVCAKIVPMDKVGLCTGILTSCFAMASLLGPILGGVIADNTTWRWVFCIPGIAVALAILFAFLPDDKSEEDARQTWKGIDGLGAFLSLAWAIPLLFALQEGGSETKYAWSSGPIIGTIVTGCVVLVIFALWEVWVYAKKEREPIFPVGLLKELVVAMMLLTMLATGFSWYVSIIQIPQRYQHVNETSATRAGILLLPLTLISPVFAMLAGTLVGKFPTSAAPLTLTGTCLNLVGMGLMSSLPTGTRIVKGQFGYQVVIGAGLGFIMPPLLYLLKVEVKDSTLASAMGAINMARTLGGCIGLAICSSLLHARLDADLSKFLTPEQIQATTSSNFELGLLTEDDRRRVSKVYGESYDLQFRVMMAFAAVNILAAGTLWWAVWRKNKSVDKASDTETGEQK